MPINSKITGAPFRFWCQKVLPAVYDDSLSYYELLCKVVDYLNKVMEDDINVVNLVNELEEYMNNYFDNLDVQQEINNKLDAMAKDGSLYSLIKPYLDDLTANINEMFNTFEEELTESNTEFKDNLTEENTEYRLHVTGVVEGQNEQIAVLESRMDTFSSLTEGSTTGDAELSDIRTAYNGQVYATAGDAVRAQFNYDNTLTNNVITNFHSVEPIAMSKQYVYINTAGSTVDITNPNDSTRLWRYAVVPCIEGDKFTINATGGNAPRGWCFIDADGTPLNRARQNVPSVMEVITAPANTAYLVINDEANNTSYKGVAKPVQTLLTELDTSLSSDISTLESNVASNYITYTKERTTPLNQIKAFDLIAMNYVHAGSSLTFVGDKLLMFSPSSDDHTNYGYIGIFNYNFSMNELALSTAVRHNFGHANTVDYCEENDTLILGNGGSSSNTENNQIYIIENFSDVLLNTPNGGNINLFNVAKIIDITDLGLGWGKQLNCFWAGGNNGKYNTIIAMSNDGTTQTLRKLQLGMGTNDLGTGTMLSGMDTNEFNGTFKILETWSRAYSTEIANNDTQMYWNKMYEISGHTGIHISENELLADGTMYSIGYRNKVYDDTGTEMYYINEGIAIRKGLLFTTGYVKPDSYTKLDIIVIQMQ